MEVRKLVMMANQIATFFAVQGEERAVPQIANHIRSFWHAQMRTAIREHIATGGAGLHPFALAALRCEGDEQAESDRPAR